MYYTHTHTQIHICKCVPLCMFIQKHTHKYIHTYICIYTHRINEVSSIICLVIRQFSFIHLLGISAIQRAVAVQLFV
jgi:hypothetical protein